MKKIISAILAAVILMTLCSCATLDDIFSENQTGVEWSEDVVAQGREILHLTASDNGPTAEIVEITEAQKTAAANFAIKLLSALNKLDKENEENELISPLSVMTALAMTANGSSASTLVGMEKALGMSIGELNEFINSFTVGLLDAETASLKSANSLWISTDRGLTVNSAFIDVAEKYYSADVIGASFGDPKTLEALNNWVEVNTDGRIKNMLDRLGGDSVMVLLNALTFDAEWLEKFNGSYEGSFTNADGSTVTAAMMGGLVSKYIEGQGCTGFIKPYADGYSYIALLPDSGTDISSFLSSLDGEKLLGLISGAKSTSVRIQMPKYSLDFSAKLNESLGALGMGVAFDPLRADFSSLGKLDDYTNMYISEVVHKTHIDVDEWGTRAAAATGVVVDTKSEGGVVENVRLDRPFVYAVIDNATGIPVFIGAVENLG